MNSQPSWRLCFNDRGSNKPTYMVWLIVVITMEKLKEKYVMWGSVTVLYWVIRKGFRDNRKSEQIRKWGHKPCPAGRCVEDTQRKARTHQEVRHVWGQVKRTQEMTLTGGHIPVHVSPCRLKTVWPLKGCGKTTGESWVEWCGLTDF